MGTIAAVNALNILGNIGVGTISYSKYLTTAAPKGGAIFEGNVGIGTATPQTGFVSMGNVGIGTWTAANGALIVQGNVGIGTALVPTTLSLKGSYSQIVITLVNSASGSAISTDVSLGNYYRVTLTGSGTRQLNNPTNPTDGQKVVWEFIQGSGSDVITMDTKFAGGTDITIPPALTAKLMEKRDFMTAIYNGVTDTWYVVAFVKRILKPFK